MDKGRQLWKEDTMSDPKPKDWDEYCEAMVSADPNRVAAAKAKYNAELLAAGRPPMFEQPELWKEDER